MKSLGPKAELVLTLFKCTQCSEELEALCAGAVEHLICLAQTCDTRKRHLSRLRAAHDEVPVFYLLTKSGVTSRNVVRVASGIWERDRDEVGNVTLGFTLETLLSISW